MYCEVYAYLLLPIHISFSFVSMMHQRQEFINFWHCCFYRCFSLSLVLSDIKIPRNGPYRNLKCFYWRKSTHCLYLQFAQWVCIRLLPKAAWMHYGIWGGISRSVERRLLVYRCSIFNRDSVWRYYGSNVSL